MVLAQVKADLEAVARFQQSNSFGPSHSPLQNQLLNGISEVTSPKNSLGGMPMRPLRAGTMQNKNSNISVASSGSANQRARLDTILLSSSILPPPGYRKRDDVSSSKKHREFVKAQELSKVLVKGTSKERSGNQSLTRESSDREELMSG